MKRPKQLPSVDRNTSKRAAAVPVGANVRPSGWTDILGQYQYPSECAGMACPL